MLTQEWYSGVQGTIVKLENNKKVMMNMLLIVSNQSLSQAPTRVTSA